MEFTVLHKTHECLLFSVSQVWVEWFGEASVSLVSKSSIRSLKDGISRRLKQQKIISATLKVAIEEAIQAASSK